MKFTLYLFIKINLLVFKCNLQKCDYMQHFQMCDFSRQNVTVNEWIFSPYWPSYFNGTVNSILLHFSVYAMESEHLADLIFLFIQIFEIRTFDDKVRNFHEKIVRIISIQEISISKENKSKTNTALVDSFIEFPFNMSRLLFYTSITPMFREILSNFYYFWINNGIVHMKHS